MNKEFRTNKKNNIERLREYSHPSPRAAYFGIETKALKTQFYSVYSVQIQHGVVFTCTRSYRQHAHCAPSHPYRAPIAPIRANTICNEAILFYHTIHGYLNFICSLSLFCISNNNNGKRCWRNEKQKIHYLK